MPWWYWDVAYAENFNVGPWDFYDEYTSRRFWRHAIDMLFQARAEVEQIRAKEKANKNPNQ